MTSKMKKIRVEFEYPEVLVNFLKAACALVGLSLEDYLKLEINEQLKQLTLKSPSPLLNEASNQLYHLFSELK